MHIVMVASEDGALKGGKVGGLGDVLHFLPEALLTLGCKVTVIVPSYGFLHTLNTSELNSIIEFPFAGKKSQGKLWKIIQTQENHNLQRLVFEHDAILGDPIYFHDPPEAPFMRDAEKYAMFCSAIAKYLCNLQGDFILHLHDWHTATILFLRELHPEFSELKKVRTVFTIHNLAFQGTRPMRSHHSSVEKWFPELFGNTEWIDKWKDSRFQEPCYTPIAIGIQCADRVNTVSPSYAKEILLPSNRMNYFYGGEGLEELLQKVSDKGKLFGILNGCEYPERITNDILSFNQLCELMISEIRQRSLHTSDEYLDFLMKKLKTISETQPKVLFTSVTRITEQKIHLLLDVDKNNTNLCEKIIILLQKHHGMYIILGSGEKRYEDELKSLCRKYEQLVFIPCYSEILSQALYSNGNLFIMPSLFEPCGISQMIAMREGQPCLAHAVGGLKDTVIDQVNGFTFSGNSITEKIENCIKKVKEALYIYFENPVMWKKIVHSAKDSKFSWIESSKKYLELCYK